MIAIRDMEMPSCCDECRFLDDDGDYPMCRVNGMQRGYNFPKREKRMDFCPLEEGEREKQFIVMTDGGLS